MDSFKKQNLSDIRCRYEKRASAEKNAFNALEVHSLFPIRHDENIITFPWFFSGMKVSVFLSRQSPFEK